MNKKLLLLGFTLVAIPCLRSYNDYRRFSLTCDLRKRADELDHRLQSKEALAVLIQARDAYPDFLDTYQEMAEIPIEQSAGTKPTRPWTRPSDAAPKIPNHWRWYTASGASAWHAGESWPNLPQTFVSL